MAANAAWITRRVRVEEQHRGSDGGVEHVVVKIRGDIREKPHEQRAPDENGRDHHDGYRRVHCNASTTRDRPPQKRGRPIADGRRRRQRRASAVTLQRHGLVAEHQRFQVDPNLKTPRD